MYSTRLFFPSKRSSSRSCLSAHSLSWRSHVSTIVNPSKEALRLYRDALRISRIFDRVYNKNGQNMGEAIRASTRHEFEEARNERDPEMIAKMLITGRKCVMDVRIKAGDPSIGFTDEERKLKEETPKAVKDAPFNPFKDRDRDPFKGIVRK